MKPWPAAPICAAAVALSACAPAYQDGAAWSSYTAHRLSAGGLRTEREPADAPYDEDTLARNFVTVALGTEPNPVGRQPGERALEPGILRRWSDPIRWTVADDSATAERDAPLVAQTFARLAAATGHDIAPVPDGAQANLFVFFLRPEDYRIIARNPPSWPSGRWLAGFIDRFGRTPATPCVATFTASGDNSPDGPHRIRFAVVLIRAGLPDRLAEACIEEELAQTMGLPNDGPDVRPSIFNDDQEFALLTGHDERLLRLLYDPELSPGMTRAEVEDRIPRLAARMAP